VSETARLPKHRREELVARLRAPESGEFEGLVVQVDAAGVVVEFPRSAAPTLPLAQPYDVAFRGAGLDGTVLLPATAVRRDEGVLSRRYHLELDERGGLELGRAFLGRRVPRVRPAEAFDVELRGPVDETVFRGRVHDISSSGLSVVVAPADEQDLYRLGAVRLRFGLPGDEGTMDFTGMIRHRLLEDGAIRYGIEFYRDRSSDFEANVLHVGQWVDAQASAAGREDAA
jgi:hypothetical protein